MLTSSRKSVILVDARFVSFLLVFASTTAMILSGTTTCTAAFRWNKHQPVHPDKSFSSLTMIIVGILWLVPVSTTSMDGCVSWIPKDDNKEKGPVVEEHSPKGRKKETNNWRFGVVDSTYCEQNRPECRQVAKMRHLYYRPISFLSSWFLQVPHQCSFLEQLRLDQSNINLCIQANLLSGNNNPCWFSSAATPASATSMDATAPGSESLLEYWTKPTSSSLIVCNLVGDGMCALYQTSYLYFPFHRTECRQVAKMPSLLPPDFFPSSLNGNNNPCWFSSAATPISTTSVDATAPASPEFFLECWTTPTFNNIVVIIVGSLQSCWRCHVCVYQVAAVWFDVNSTVIGEEGIDVLSEYVGEGEKVANLQATEGGMNFQDALQ
jgi:hypothetical protein